MGWIAAVGERGETIAPPPLPPSEDFGPLGAGSLDQRVRAIRDGTAPFAVTHPGGSPTVVNPGDSIATKITTAGAGGTLWFTKGTHNVTAQLVPLTGQTWVLESIAGYTRAPGDSAVLDGGNGALNALVMSPNANVTIRGGVWQNQGNIDSATFASAIFHNGGSAKGGWLVQDAIVKDNFFAGVKFSAPNCVARRVYMTNNGRYGPNCTENDSFERYTGIVFDKCRWSFNNSRLLDTGTSAGGSKFLHCPGLVISQCWVHDNHGFAIWPDVPNVCGDIEVSNNVVENNRRAGIFLEGPTGGNVVTRNYLINNGTSAVFGGSNPADTNNSQMMITNSDSTLGSGIRSVVSRNVFDFTGAQAQSLGRLFVIWNHDTHPGRCRNWDITTNQFWLRDSTFDERIGGRDTAVTGSPQMWAGDIDFIDNEYHVAAPSNQYWEWDTDSGVGTARNYTDWRIFHPADDVNLVQI